METVKENAADEYLNKVLQRLKAEGYDVESDIEYKDQRFKYLAKRKRFNIDKLNYLYNIFILSSFSSLDVDTLKGYSS